MFDLGNGSCNNKYLDVYILLEELQVGNNSNFSDVSLHRTKTQWKILDFEDLAFSKCPWLSIRIYLVINIECQLAGLPRVKMYPGSHSIY